MTVVGLSRSVQQYRPTPKNDGALWLPAAARGAASGGVGREPQADLPALHGPGIPGPVKEARKLPRRDRVAAQVPVRPMQRWSIGFIGDQLVDYRRFRVFNDVDDHRRFCPGQVVDISISGARWRASSATWRSATGCRGRSSSVATEVRHRFEHRWRQARTDQPGDVRLVREGRRPAALHRAGRPVNGKLRDECLTRTGFARSPTPATRFPAGDATTILLHYTHLSMLLKGIRFADRGAIRWVRN